MKSSTWSPTCSRAETVRARCFVVYQRRQAALPRFILKVRSITNNDRESTVGELNRHWDAALELLLGLSVAAVYVAKSRVLQRIREEAEGLID